MNGKETSRWNWMVQTYLSLDESTRNRIVSLAIKKKGISATQDMIEAMNEMGLVIKGTDPFPPPPVLAMEDGAKEYDEIMFAQEMVS